MSLILVEGPDGGGKTSVAKTALDDFDYKHNGPPDPGNTPADTFWWQLEGLHPPYVERALNSSATGAGLSARWVVDRNWPSEQIYHRFAGRPHVFHPMAHRMFERYMLANQGMVVMCLPPYQVAYKHWRQRADEGKELLVEDEQFATMYEFYKAWPRTTCLPVIEYDWTQRGPGWLAQRVFQRQHDLPKNPFPGQLYGNPGARILVVGEQYNVKQRQQGPHIPFVGYGRNGFWLTQQLEMTGLRESDLAWVNARQPDGSSTDPSVLFAVNPRVVLALGGVALDWVEGMRPRHGCTVLGIPHPAYWTRFKSKGAYPLHDHSLYLQQVAGEIFE